MGGLGRLFMDQRDAAAAALPVQRFAQLVADADGHTIIVVDTAMSPDAKMLYEHLAVPGVEANYPNIGFKVEVRVGWYLSGRRWIQYYACGVLTVTIRADVGEPAETMRFK